MIRQEMVRNSREEWKTRAEVFDAFTERVLIKLSSQKHFDGLSSIVSPGKEAVVFAAAKGEEFVAVKIYKLETAKFSKMYDYIRVDPRYQRVQNRKRQVIFKWAEREYNNLLLMREAGISVPMPITHRDNIIVMEFIGHDQLASPLLAHNAPENPEDFAEETFRQLEVITKAGFVHGDLSEFNIINHDERPVFIDFSHMAPLKAPNSDFLLERDVKNVCRYFSKIGIDKDPETVLKELS
ncbi:serine protein kinase RIO [Candidatus Woesearchaeota archaeon]|nr:serine protein kinase RIO [Candidatus Woesearchaeota archaeon]